MYYLISKHLNSTVVRDSAQNYFDPLKIAEACFVTQHVMNLGEFLTSFGSTIVTDCMSFLQKKKACSISKVQPRKRCSSLRFCLVGRYTGVLTVHMAGPNAKGMGDTGLNSWTGQESCRLPHTIFH